MTSPFDDGPGEWTGPPLTDDMVRQAEATLGVRLPPAYVDLLRLRNGGVLRDTRHPTSFRTSWAADHFAVDVLLGVGYPEGADAQSAYLIAEWGYPDVGVVIGVTPSAGHDTVMLDYSGCGPAGEPAVVYVDDDRLPRRVADSFGQFMSGLEPDDEG
ncbi:SMI1/KNR4 family protein [Actinoplanes sp. NPDC004185]